MMEKRKKLRSEQNSVIPTGRFVLPIHCHPERCPSRARAVRAREGPGFVLHLDAALRRQEPRSLHSARALAPVGMTDRVGLLIPGLMRCFQLHILVSGKQEQGCADQNVIAPVGAAFRGFGNASGQDRAKSQPRGEASKMS